MIPLICFWFLNNWLKTALTINSYVTVLPWQPPWLSLIIKNTTNPGEGLLTDVDYIGKCGPNEWPYSVRATLTAKLTNLWPSFADRIGICSKTAVQKVWHHCKSHFVILAWDGLKDNKKFSKPIISRKCGNLEKDFLEWEKKGFKKDLPSLRLRKVFHVYITYK